jgi:hypothetical protein
VFKAGAAQKKLVKMHQETRHDSEVWPGRLPPGEGAGPDLCALVWKLTVGLAPKQCMVMVPR